MAGFIDIHHHIIYGVDDGPHTESDSIRMVEAAQEEGIRYIIATSHAIPSMEPFPLDRYYRHLDQLNQICQERSLNVAIYDGCEIFYSDIAVRQLSEQRLPTLAGSRYVLIEFDPTHGFDSIETAIRQIGNIGLTPIVAHCERYASLVKRTEALIELRQKYRMRLQINAATMTGRCPRPIRKFRDGLMKAQALDYVASDAHNTASRKVNLREAYEEIARTYGTERADELTGRNQREIFVG